MGTARMKLIRSMKRRLLLFALCISLTPIVIITTVYYIHARGTQRHQIFEELKAIAESKRLHILSFMETIKIQASDFSTDGFIRGRVDMVASGDRVFKEGNRIANIIYSLLSYARRDENEKPSMIHISKIISETLILTESQLRKDGIIIKLDIQEKMPDIVVYPQQIQQVFLNVISNARYALNQKYQKLHNNKILEILGEEITLDNYPYVKINGNYS